MNQRTPPQSAIGDLLQRGYREQQQGRPDLAAADYQAVLARQPRNFDALHLLGLLALQTNDAPSAITWLEKAVAVKPGDPAVRSTLGVALQASGRPDHALASFEHAIRLHPTLADYHYNRGKALRELSRLEDALGSYDTALKLNPDYLPALTNRSEVLLALHRAEEALASTDAVLLRRPDHAEALSNRGIALLALQRPDAALETLDTALRLKPGMPNALFHRGKTLSMLNRHAEALAVYEQAIAIRPGSAEQIRAKADALRNLGRHDEALACANGLSRQPESSENLHQLGLILNDMRRPAEALDHFKRTLALKPDHADALNNMGNALMQLNRIAEARRAYEQALVLAPQDASAHWNLCLCLLLTGSFAQGWAEYDWRWATVLKNLRPSFEVPQWDGRPLAGTLLVWGEQGLGDQVIYSSMLAETAQLAQRLIVAGAPRLQPLLARSFPGIEFTTLDQAKSAAAFDRQIAMGDLGRHLRRSADDFLQHRRTFLKADPQRVSRLRTELDASSPVRLCGLSWNSNNKAVGREKSMALRDLLPLLSAPAHRFVDLQYGDTAAERGALRQDSGIDVARVDSIDTWNDIDGLAALIDACDVIVTISNTTAHIAGALGKTVYLMLPYSQGRFWYWQTDRDDSLWYPKLRIFRQQQDGDWSGVIAQIRATLLASATDAGKI